MNRIVLRNAEGRLKVIEMENDIVLIILSIFGFGWIKLFVDGRMTQGIINILLLYIPFGALIHGIYLGLKPEKYLNELLDQGYEPNTEEDAQKLKNYLTN